MKMAARRPPPMVPICGIGRLATRSSMPTTRPIARAGAAVFKPAGAPISNPMLRRGTIRSEFRDPATDAARRQSVTQISWSARGDCACLKAPLTILNTISSLTGRSLWAAAIRRIVRVRREVASEYVDVRAPCVWTIFDNRGKCSSGASRLELDDADAHEAHRPSALKRTDFVRAAPVAEPEARYRFSA